MLLTPIDLAPFADIPEPKALLMIQDAVAMAGRAAPCLVDNALTLTAPQGDAVRAILRRAILRWHDVGSGAVTQVTAGSFQQSMDTSRAASKSLFWPSEVNDLQAICMEVTNSAGADTKVFTISTAHRGPVTHSPICDLSMGGASCSCGSDLNAFRGPLPMFGEVMP